jgi:hypothetical protein
MTTPQQRFRGIILDVIHAAGSNPVTLQAMYDAVQQQTDFDEDDLRPPMLHGSRIQEPSWRRNVRNTLQQMKDAGTLVNHAHNEWRLASPDPARQLDLAASWAVIADAAERSAASGEIFASVQRGVRYRIGAVSPERITIARVDANEAAVLTRGEAEKAIARLNAAGGKAGRRTLNYTVAKETAIVHLHPDLRWDDTKDWVEIVPRVGETARPVETGVPVDYARTPSPPSRRVRERDTARRAYRALAVAAANDPDVMQYVARRIRRGQRSFRQGLLALYESRCAISGFGPESVLEAAHILEHASSGLNQMENGILLRADLHALFDDHLLRLDPDTYRVVLDPALRDSPYAEFEGQMLRPRVDGSHPSRELLRDRWMGTPRAIVPETDDSHL